MENNARSNLKIVGDSSAAGGYYNNAKIVGNGIINGDLDCFGFKTVGDSRLNGKLKSENLKVVGSLSIAGTAKSNSIVIQGNLDSDGDIQSNKIVLRGGITTKGSIKGDKLEFKGYVTVEKNCESEIFNAEGQLRINGLLNSGEVTIRTYGQSRIAEIGGEKITIKKGSASSIKQMIKFFFMPSFHNGALVADSIEGDEIHLAHTKAKVVRGKNIIIDPDCEIDLVEYKDNLSIRGKSTVREKRKIQ